MNDLPSNAGGAASLTERLFATLSSQIRAGTWAPGERLPTQKELSEREAVSRTVVREAMARLDAHGLTTSRQGSGVYVADAVPLPAFQVDQQQLHELAGVIELLEFRLGIETEMAGFAAARRSTADLGAIRAALRVFAACADDPEAAARADAEFHRAIAQASRNSHYVNIVEFLGVRMVPVRTIYLRNQSASAHAAYFARINAEHEAIAEAIVRMDADAARYAARTHMIESLARHGALADRYQSE